MASAYQRGSKWWIKYVDAYGRRRQESTAAKTKTEAKKLAQEQELRAERQRRGLEPIPPRDGGGTVAELMKWWLDEHASRHASAANTWSAVTKHILGAWIAPIRLTELRPGDVARFLHEKGASLSPQSVNHLRKFLSAAFAKAIEFRRWEGHNPIAATKKMRVPKPALRLLREDEILPMLQEVALQHRALFATAIYAGLRRGELFALRKSDVDLKARRMTVGRSHARATTKGGHADEIQIPAELVPYLEHAMAASRSDLVFPDAEGGQRSRHTKLEVILRRALRRAGIVERWTHVCRVKGCMHRENAGDSDVRRCPVHDHKLWPKGIVRAVRFHDLRHLCATLSLRRRIPLAVVQRQMRHTDPKITAMTYGHLDNEFMQIEVDRLQLGTIALPPSSPCDLLPAATAGSSQSLRTDGDGDVEKPAGGRRRAGEGLVRSGYTAAADGDRRVQRRARNQRETQRKPWRATQNSNLRPLASEANALSS